MRKDAKTLLDDLKKGVHFFKVQDYQYQDYEGEIAEIAKYCQQRNAQAILSLLKNKNTQKTFEIKHPLYNDIILRAVYSIANHANNYVFFVDSSNTFCLCIVQNCNFVNFFITEQTIFRVSYVWEGAMGGSIGYLCAQSRARNILPQHITYKESEFAYNLYHYRPAHYFGHMLANYIHLQDKPVFQKQCFFLPRNTKIITEYDRVLFYPMTYLHQCLTQCNFLVFNESLQNFNSLVAPRDKLDKFDKEEISESEINQLTLNNIHNANNYSLTLWLGIPGERRVWLEQWEGIPLILKNLSRYFPSIKVYVDGMTAYDGERIEVKNNLEAFWKIVENTKEVFEVGDSASCKDAKQTAASLRGSEAKAFHSPLASLRGSEAKAIHNQAKSNFNNEITTGEIKDYRLPRDSNESLAMTKSQPPHHCEQSEAIHSPLSSLRGEAEAIHNVDNQKIRNGSRDNDKDSKNSCIIYGARGEKIAFKSLSGYDYRTKICYCVMCDIVISEIATTALVPFIFCKKSGVAFQTFVAGDIIPKIKHLKIVKNDTIKRINVCSDGLSFDFHFPPEHIYNLAAESLEELSKEGKLASFSKDNPLKMHRLNVPPVELYTKKHTLEQKTKITISSNKSTKRLLKEISYQKQLLEIESLELDIQLKQLQIKSNGIIPPSPTPNTAMQGSAKDRIHNHLAYKLGKALILNSKSLWGYIRMPYVLSYIKESHKKEILDYEARVKKNPSLKLPKLESYPDYKEALKEKECFTYKLGEALMQADKDWYKGGYLRFYFKELPRLKREFREKKK